MGLKVFSINGCIIGRARGQCGAGVGNEGFVQGAQLMATQSAQLLGTLHGLQNQFRLHHQGEGVQCEGGCVHGGSPVAGGSLCEGL